MDLDPSRQRNVSPDWGTYRDTREGGTPNVLGRAGQVGRGEERRRRERKRQERTIATQASGVW